MKIRWVEINFGTEASSKPYGLHFNAVHFNTRRNKTSGTKVSGHFKIQINFEVSIYPVPSAREQEYLNIRGVTPRQEGRWSYKAVSLHQGRPC